MTYISPSIWVSEKLEKNIMLLEFDGRDPTRSALDSITMHEWNITNLISKNRRNTGKENCFFVVWQ